MKFTITQFETENKIANPAIALIEAERERQINKEGWTPEHDNLHAEGELAVAAACYALPFVTRLNEMIIIAKLWPFAWGWWKPTPENRIKELTKAGALIVAELERFLRLQK